MPEVVSMGPQERLQLLHRYARTDRGALRSAATNVCAEQPQYRHPAPRPQVMQGCNSSRPGDSTGKRKPGCWAVAVMRAPHCCSGYGRARKGAHLTRSTSSTRRIALRSRCTKSAMRSCLDAAPCLRLLPPHCPEQRTRAIKCRKVLRICTRQACLARAAVSCGSSHGR